jgi:hypothetical protein
MIISNQRDCLDSLPKENGSKIKNKNLETLYNAPPSQLLSSTQV